LAGLIGRGPIANRPAFTFDGSLWIVVDATHQRLTEYADGQWFDVYVDTPYAPGGGGGGAFTGDHFVVTQDDADLSNETTIPGLVASADIIHEVGTVHEDYSTNVTGLTWDSLPSVVDANTTVLSHLFISMQGDSTARFGGRAYAPGGGVAFDVKCKLNVGTDSGSNGQVACGLFVADTVPGVAPNNMVLIHSTRDRQSSNLAQVLCYSVVGGGFTQQGNTIWMPYTYFWIHSDGLGGFDLFGSLDGIVWDSLSGSFAFLPLVSGNVKQIGYRPRGVVAGKAISDWLTSS
jgi:hypothetical protein